MNGTEIGNVAFIMRAKTDVPDGGIIIGRITSFFCKLKYLTYKRFMTADRFSRDSSRVPARCCNF